MPAQIRYLVFDIESAADAELVAKPKGTYRKFYEMQRESRGTHVA